MRPSPSPSAATRFFKNYHKLDKALQSEEYVPADGLILPKTTYVLREGDTVFNILDRTARYNKIQLEYQGADRNLLGTVYIQGIHYLYEFSCGGFRLGLQRQRPISQLRLWGIRAV